MELIAGKNDGRDQFNFVQGKVGPISAVIWMGFEARDGGLKPGAVSLQPLTEIVDPSVASISDIRPHQF